MLEAPMTESSQRRPTDPTLVDHPLPLPASERTLVDPPPDALASDARTRTIADPPSSDRFIPEPITTPVIPDVGIEALLDPNAPREMRYEIGVLLGTGSSSHVYAGHDRTFDRAV